MVRVELLCAGVCSGILLLAAGLAAAQESGEAAKSPEEAKDEQNTSRCRKYEELEAATGVTFVVVALFGGLICYHGLSKIPLPYTALLLVRPVPTLLPIDTPRAHAHTFCRLAAI